MRKLQYLFLLNVPVEVKKNNLRMAILVLQRSLEANSLRQVHFFYLLIKIKLLIRKILPNRQNYFYGKATLGFLCVINFV